MGNLIPAQLIIISEIGIVLAIISAAVIFMLFRARKKERQLTRDMIKEFKQTSPVRKEKLLLLLKEKYRLDDEDAEKCMDEIYNQEKRLYVRILNIFYRHQTSEIARIHENIQALAAAYENLADSSQPVLHDPAPKNEDANDTREMDRLLDENERLKNDLKQALASVEHIQAEYLAIYEKYEKKQS